MQMEIEFYLNTTCQILECKPLLDQTYLLLLIRYAVRVKGKERDREIKRERKRVRERQRKSIAIAIVIAIGESEYIIEILHSAYLTVLLVYYSIGFTESVLKIWR